MKSDKLDITMYDDDELSFRVFSDEFLRKRRFYVGLLDILEEEYIFTEDQKNVLLQDIVALQRIEYDRSDED